MRQILEGLNAVHKMNLAHYDLKLDQILISHDYIVKITDFGLAKTLISKNPDDSDMERDILKVSCSRNFDDVDQYNMKSSTRGLYAPELKRAQERLLEVGSNDGEMLTDILMYVNGVSVDIFSVGAMLHFMMYQSYPTCNKEYSKVMVINGKVVFDPVTGKEYK